MVGTENNCENFFKMLLSSARGPKFKNTIFVLKIRLLSSTRGPKFKNTIFREKCLFSCYNFFICNYLTAMQYTVGTNSLSGRERDIICQFKFICVTQLQKSVVCCFLVIELETQIGETGFRVFCNSSIILIQNKTLY